MGYLSTISTNEYIYYKKEKIWQQISSEYNETKWFCTAQWCERIRFYDYLVQVKTEPNKCY